MKISEDCTLPATFTISDFVTIGGNGNATMNSTMFHFTDSATGIDTNCYQNFPYKRDVADLSGGL